MSDFDIPAGHKYVATITGVREVTLVGSADFAFWKDRLRNERLFPARIDGQAQIVVSTIAARFLGLRFSEACQAVAVSRTEDGEHRDGLYFLQAFNTSRLFTWFERTCFSTPYLHGQMTLDETVPASVQISDGDATVFAAVMSQAASPVRSPLCTGEDPFRGPIFLPGGKLFYADLRGDTRVYSVLPTDHVTLHSSPRTPVFDWLRDSQFAPREWWLRSSAVHARGKTLPRAR
jgi:hypothetical protein